MDSKLKLFKDLLNEFDVDRYNEITNNVHVLNSVLYERGYDDQLIVVYKQNLESTFSSFNHSLSYKITDAYEKIFGISLSSYIEFIEQEKLSKYESINDYFRVKEIEKQQRQTNYDETISKYKERYAREAASPEDLHETIRNQQKKIDKLSKQLKKKRWFR